MLVKYIRIIKGECSYHLPNIINRPSVLISFVFTLVQEFSLNVFNEILSEINV